MSSLLFSAFNPSCVPSLHDRYAHEKLRCNKEIALIAVHKAGCALEWASEELRADKEVVLEACRADGFALQFAVEELRGDEEVVAAAMRNRVEALQFATMKNGSWKQYAQSSYHKNEPEACRRSREIRRRTIQHLRDKTTPKPQPLTLSLDAVPVVVEQDPVTARPFKRVRQKTSVTFAGRAPRGEPPRAGRTGRGVAPSRHATTHTETATGAKRRHSIAIGRCARPRAQWDHMRPTDWGGRNRPQDDDIQSTYRLVYRNGSKSAC